MSGSIQATSALIIRSTCDSSPFLTYPILCDVSIHSTINGNHTDQVQSLDLNPCGVDNVIFLWDLSSQKYVLRLVACTSVIEGNNVHLLPIPSVFEFDLGLQPFAATTTLDDTVSILVKKSTEFNIDFTANTSQNEQKLQEDKGCSLEYSHILKSPMNRKLASHEVQNPSTNTSTTGIYQDYISARNPDDDFSQLFEKLAKQDSRQLEYEYFLVFLMLVFLIASFTFALAIKFRQKKSRKSWRTTQKFVEDNEVLQSSDNKFKTSPVLDSSKEGGAKTISLSEGRGKNIPGVASSMLKSSSSFLDSGFLPHLRDEGYDPDNKRGKEPIVASNEKSSYCQKEDNAVFQEGGEDVPREPFVKRAITTEAEIIKSETYATGQPYPRLVTRANKKEKDTVQMKTATDDIQSLASSADLHKGPKRLIALISIGVIDRFQAANQARALALLKAKETKYIIVNGMDQNQRERRNELFKISNIKGNYPQFFLEQMDGTTRYIGSWEYLQSLNEISSSLSSEIPRLRRCIESWETVFDDLVLSFNSEGDEKT